MPFLCTFKYQMQTARGPTGWSENFWNNSVDGGDAVSQALSLGNMLRNVHSNKALMQGISVRQVDNNPAVRTTRLVRYVAINETPAAAAFRYAGMYPTTALRMQLESGEGRSNYVYLKGMPDGIDVGGDYTPLIGWSTFLAQLRGELISELSEWVRRQLLDTNAKIPLDAVNPDGTITAKNHLLVANDRVRIGRTNSNPNIDKVYRVKDVLTANTFTVVGFPPVEEAPEITDASYVQKQFYQASTLVRVTANAITKKNVGRPTGSPVGRQTTPRR
jgi:hypothetical protein